MTRTELRRKRRAAALRIRAALTFTVVLTAVILALTLSTPSAAENEQAQIPTETASAPAIPPIVIEPEKEDSTAEFLAKTIYGEARGCSITEQAAIVWCVLNRVDDNSGQWPDDIIGVVTQPSQFHGYDPDHPVLPELLAVAEDVLARWEIEDACVGGVGRVLPKEYTYFSGDGRHNYFRTEWTGGTTWAWGLESPYEE